MKKPWVCPPDSARQMRPACTSAKLAEGNASFCAAGIVRYSTAKADGAADTTTAAGMVQLIHRFMPDLALHVRCRAAPVSGYAPPQKKNPIAPRNESDSAPTGSLFLTC